MPPQKAVVRHEDGQGPEGAGGLPSGDEHADTVDETEINGHGAELPGQIPYPVLPVKDIKVQIKLLPELHKEQKKAQYQYGKKDAALRSLSGKIFCFH